MSCRWFMWNARSNWERWTLDLRYTNIPSSSNSPKCKQIEVKQCNYCPPLSTLCLVYDQMYVQPVHCVTKETWLLTAGCCAIVPSIILKKYRCLSHRNRLGLHQDNIQYNIPKALHSSSGKAVNSANCQKDHVVTSPQRSTVNEVRPAVKNN